MSMTKTVRDMLGAAAVALMTTLPGAALAQVQTQDDIAAHVSAAEPAKQSFIKDQPILGWTLTGDDMAALPDVIRENLGGVDGTGYDAAYLAENKGSIVALQMTGSGPDFYIIGLPTFRDSYVAVPLDEVAEKNGRLVERLEMVPELAAMFDARDPSLVGALKSVPVEMIAMSDAGYDIAQEVTIQAPWGTQTKPAGQEAFLVYDTGESQYYMVNSGPDGLPLSYVPAE
ncbi:hypothetical protein [Marinibacterium profundimaris]|uniref:Lipoprotein n=1 Tax=Marinibacterium profundimaris TaxID=1679460 RepID=A0A225NP77_9RHOB|nr:hypothetical protein [Marinibacterium profundimaris]OWU76069.1 hypothetical protein ATO3_07885 [Marinibacterium profundimaris]